MKPRRPYYVSPDEIGPLARALREARGDKLKEAAKLIGCDVSNLSKAERGHPSYTSLATRAVEVYARERAREAGDRRPDRYVVRTEIRVPHVVNDAVDVIREPERSRRRVLVTEVFRENGIDVKRGDQPDRLRATYGGRAFRVSLDRLVITAEGRPVRPFNLSSNNRADDPSTEMAFYHRAAEWIKQESAR